MLQFLLKYDIRFSKLTNLTLKWNADKETINLDSSIFPININSLVLHFYRATNDGKGYKLTDNSNKDFSTFVESIKKLNPSSTTIIIGKRNHNICRNTIRYCNKFPKVKRIEWRQWNIYGGAEKYTETDFEALDVQEVVLADWTWFGDNAVKAKFIDTGFIKKLNKVEFSHTSKYETNRIRKLIDGLPKDVDFNKFYINGYHILNTLLRLIE